MRKKIRPFGKPEEYFTYNLPATSQRIIWKASEILAANKFCFLEHGRDLWLISAYICFRCRANVPRRAKFSYWTRIDWSRLAICSWFGTTVAVSEKLFYVSKVNGMICKDKIIRFLERQTTVKSWHKIKTYDDTESLLEVIS